MLARYCSSDIRLLDMGDLLALPAKRQIPSALLRMIYMYTRTSKMQSRRQ